LWGVCKSLTNAFSSTAPPEVLSLVEYDFGKRSPPGCIDPQFFENCIDRVYK